MSSLYEQLGGQPAIDAAVDVFYRKVLTDDSISHFFTDVDMDHQIARQKAFLTMAFGGPNQYQGADLRNAHQRLVARGLNDSHFNAVAGHLNETLRELGVAPALIDQVMSIAGGAKNDVLNR